MVFGGNMNSSNTEAKEKASRELESVLQGFCDRGEYLLQIKETTVQEIQREIDKLSERLQEIESKPNTIATAIEQCLQEIEKIKNWEIYLQERPVGEDLDVVRSEFLERTENEREGLQKSIVRLSNGSTEFEKEISEIRQRIQVCRDDIKRWEDWEAYIRARITNSKAVKE